MSQRRSNNKKPNGECATFHGPSGYDTEWTEEQIKSCKNSVVFKPNRQFIENFLKGYYQCHCGHHVLIYKDETGLGVPPKLCKKHLIEFLENSDDPHHNYMAKVIIDGPKYPKRVKNEL